MAYLEKEKVAEIRKELKKVLTTKEGFKLSVTREHYSGVNVNIMQSPIEFPKGYEQINEYSFQNHSKLSSAAKGVISVIMHEINKVTGGSYNRNAEDLGADYPDYNFFININVGKWDKECVFI